MSLKTNEPLEIMMSATPLPVLEDLGFTKSVLTRTRRLTWQRLGLNATVWACTLLSFLAVIPWRNFLAEMQQLMTPALYRLDQLTNVVVIEEWLQGGIIQQFTNNQAMLLTVLIMTLFAGLTADLVTEE
jgi:hypothetical protein